MASSSSDQNATSGLLFQTFLVNSLRPYKEAYEVHTYHFRQIDAGFVLFDLRSKLVVINFIDDDFSHSEFDSWCQRGKLIFSSCVLWPWSFCFYLFGEALKQVLSEHVRNNLFVLFSRY
jgi:hypothetical protein